jgi:hypothetical protein
MILLRRVRRLASFENNDLANLWKLEFRTGDNRPDLSISVYEVEDQTGRFAQVHAEHCASIPIDPPKRDGEGLNLSNLDGTEVVSTPGKSQFIFTRERHREVKLASADALQAAIVIIASQREERMRVVAQKEIQLYVHQQLAANDDEWVRVCASNESWQKWATKEVVRPR